MTVLVSEILSRVTDVLSDTANVRWTSVELIRWVNDAMREISKVQPESNVVIGNLTLAAGTKQALPTGGIALGKLTRNMGVNGTTPDVAPRLTTQALMDAHRPGWHYDTATLVVKNYMKDARHPRTFYVWPPMSGATQVEAEYSAIPTAVAATGDAITLPDFYVNPIVDYVLYRAFSKDIEIPGMLSKSKERFAAFQESLQATEAGEAKET